MGTSTTNTISFEQFEAMPEAADHELVRGELRKMSPAGANHGKIAMRFGGLLWQHIDEHDLGEVYAAETGFLLSRNPDTLRAPDVAFVQKARIPEDGEPDGFWDLVPDLIVEVVSPHDRASEVQQKMQDYLVAGVRLAWLVDPASRTITVYEALDKIRLLLEEDQLDGGDVLPDFSLSLAKLFC